MTILHIETSTQICSVALSNNGNCIFRILNSEGQNHAAMLSLFIQAALEEASKMKMKPDAIAVSEGPGSYTGLRIGVSTAKGLCYGYNIPLIAVSTLEIMCVEALKMNEIKQSSLLCPMIDARRMEVYTTFYHLPLEKKRAVSAEIISIDSFRDLLENHAVYFFGNGAEKCKPVITHPHAIFIDNIEPLAENMISIAERKFQSGDFVDTAYFEPFYLKEFQVTTAKKIL